MSYKRRNLDLTAVNSNPTELVPARTRVQEVFITKLPAGATLQIQFGQTSDPIDIDAPVSFKPTGEDGNNGLYWLNPTAQPGVSVDIYVVTGATDTLNERVDK